MAQTAELNGQLYVQQPDGRYVEANATEAEVLRGDPRAVAVKSIVAQLYGFGNLLAGATLMSASRANPTPLVTSRFSKARAQLAEAEQIRALRPGPAEQGNALLDILSILPVGRGARGVQQGVRSGMAERVAAGLGHGSAVADGAVDRAFGATSVGAAQGGEVRGMGSFFRNLTDQLDTPRRLSADQYEILQSGLAREVGFEFPPMSLNNEQTYASVLSNPLLNRDIMPVLFANSKKLSDDFAAAVGLNPADYPRGFGRKMLAAGDAHFSRQYNKFYRALDSAAPDGMDLSAIVEDLNPYLHRELRAKLQTQGGVVDGRTLGEIRSRLNNDVLPVVWRGDDFTARQVVEDAIESIDDLMARTLDQRTTAGQAQLAELRQTRQQYRTWLATKRPGVVDRTTGDISLKSLAIQLEKQYPRSARTADLDELGLMPQTTELLKFSRVARSFADSLADSGTPTRSLLTLLATNPKQVPQFLALRHAIDNISLTPEQALRLAE